MSDTQLKQRIRQLIPSNSFPGGLGSRLRQALILVAQTSTQDATSTVNQSFVNSLNVDASTLGGNSASYYATQDQITSILSTIDGLAIEDIDGLSASLANMAVTNSDNNFSTDQTFAQNVTITGNLTVNGTQFITNTETVEVEDNLLLINNGEVGSGVTAGLAGIEIDRGASTNYQFVFEEATDLFKVGVAGSLQAVATRPDSPTDGYFAKWNSSGATLDFVDIDSELTNYARTDIAETFNDQVTLQGDGSNEDILLRFGLDGGRDWTFQQLNSGAGTALGLKSLSNKSFYIDASDFFVRNWNATATAFSVSRDSNLIRHYVATLFSSTTTFDQLATFNSNVQFNSSSVAFAGSITIPDYGAGQNAVRIGTGNDLIIYHDGASNWIQSSNGSVLNFISGNNSHVWYTSGVERMRLNTTNGLTMSVDVDITGDISWTGNSSGNHNGTFGGASSSQYARTDIAETFDDSLTVGGVLTVATSIESASASINFLNSPNALPTRHRGVQVSTSYTGVIPDDGILFGTDTTLSRTGVTALTLNGTLNANTLSSTTGTFTNATVGGSNVFTDADFQSQIVGVYLTSADLTTAIPEAFISASWNGSTETITFGNLGDPNDLLDISGTYAKLSGDDFTGNISVDSQYSFTGTSSAVNSPNEISFLNGASAQASRHKGLQVSTIYTGVIPDNGILFGTDTTLTRTSVNTLTASGTLSATTFSGTTGTFTNATVGGSDVFTQADYTTQIEGVYLTSASLVNYLDKTATGEQELAGNLYVNSGQAIAMGAGSPGQIRASTTDYTFAVALDANGVHLYHNSSARDLILGTDETARIKISGAGKIGYGGNYNASYDHYFNGSVYFAGTVYNLTANNASQLNGIDAVNYMRKDSAAGAQNMFNNITFDLGGSEKVISGFVRFDINGSIEANDEIITDSYIRTGLATGKSAGWNDNWKLGENVTTGTSYVADGYVEVEINGTLVQLCRRTDVAPT